RNGLMVFVHDVNHDVMGLIHILFAMGGMGRILVIAFLFPKIHKVIGKHISILHGFMEKISDFSII
ncbi:MAG: hypothetical protein PF503_05755, partial [Desulfobacula sp.]|nr:hypothetical protein [Desulfobacula sp.]